METGYQGWRFETSKHYLGVDDDNQVTLQLGILVSDNSFKILSNKFKSALI